MNNSVLTESTFELLISRTAHSINLIEQKQLVKHNIAPRQLYILRIIEALGPNATAVEVARVVDREVHVIARLAVTLENNGLIKRTKKTPKSKLLHLTLTKKGMDMLKVKPESQAVRKILASIPKDEFQQMDATLSKILGMLKEYRQSLQ